MCADRVVRGFACSGLRDFRWTRSVVESELYRAEDLYNIDIEYMVLIYRRAWHIGVVYLNARSCSSETPFEYLRSWFRTP